MSSLPVLSVPLTITRSPGDVAGLARRREPVTFGVPLPPRAAADITGWQLVTADERSTAVQATALDHWEDGSIRWLLVDAQIDVAGDSPAAARLVRTEELPPFRGVVITPGNGALTVDTGAVRFELREGGAFPFERVSSAQGECLDAVASGFEIVDAAGRTYRAAVSRVRVLNAGAWRATVAVEGKWNAPGAPLELQASLDFYAGQPVVRAAFRLRNPQRAEHRGGFWDLGDAGSVYIRDASWTIGLRGDADAHIRCSPEIGIAHRQFEAPFEIYQDSSGGENWRSTAHVNRHGQVPHSFRGYRLRSGTTETAGRRATPVVTVESGTRVLSLAVPLFWQNFPKAIEADGRKLILRLFPRQYADLHELQGGEQKTHTCVCSFGADLVTVDPLEWCRTPARVHVQPGWCLSTGAVPWLAADDSRHAALVASAVVGSDTFERKREVVDEYGWRHFGDIYGDHEAIRHAGPMPLVSHYNNQYDPIAGFLYQDLRTGDPHWFTMAADLAAHVIDIDVYHTVRDKWAYNHGLFWHTYHYGDAGTSSHRTYPRAARGIVHGGGPSPDHNYTTGLMLYYFMTGDTAARETVIDLAQFIIDADDGARTPLRWLSRAPTGFATASGSYAYHGPGRGPANSLNALLDGHRLSGERRFLDKAEALIRRVVHPADDVTRHRLDDPENRWFYLMFLQSLGKYLGYKAERAELDGMYAYGRAALLTYARWMAQYEYPYLEKPEKLQFPTETWAAHEIRKSDVFHHAALHASVEERRRFLERANHFFGVCVETLERMPTRTLARPVVVLLSSGMMQGWREQHPNAELPPPNSPRADFGDPVEFIPQKQQALARAKRIALVGGGLALALGGWYAF